MIVYKKMSEHNKKLIIKIILSVVCVAAVALIIFLGKDAFASKADGEIQFVYVDVEGKTIIDEKIEFNEGQSLVGILQENYDNIKIENGMIMTFEDYVTPSDWSTFITIYVNDEMSMVGINDIQFEDGTKISFVITEYVPY